MICEGENSRVMDPDPRYISSFIFFLSETNSITHRVENAFNAISLQVFQSYFLKNNTSQTKLKIKKNDYGKYYI